MLKRLIRLGAIAIALALITYLASSGLRALTAYWDRDEKVLDLSLRVNSKKVDAPPSEPAEIMYDDEDLQKQAKHPPIAKLQVKGSPDLPPMPEVIRTLQPIVSDSAKLRTPDFRSLPPPLVFRPIVPIESDEFLVKPVRDFEGDGTPAEAIAFAPRCQQVLLGYQSGRLALWRLDEQRDVQLFSAGTEPIVAVDIARQDFVAAASGNQVSVWKIDDGTLVSSFTAGVPRVLQVSFDADQHFLATIGDGKLEIWRTETGELVKSVATTDRCFAYSEGGVNILTAGPGSLALVELDPIAETKRVTYAVDKVPRQAIQLGLHRNAGVALTGGKYTWLRLNRLREEVFAAAFVIQGAPGDVQALGILPDCNDCVMYAGDTALRMCSLDQLEDAGHSDGDTSQVVSAAVASNGVHALTGYRDGTVRLFSLPAPLLTPVQYVARMRTTVMQLLQSNEFEKLDALFAQELATDKTMRSGFGRMEGLYEVTAHPYPQEPERLQMRVPELAKWLEARPESVPAHLALAQAEILIGWQHRGGGFASDVSHGGAIRYVTCLQRAAELLDECAESAADDPQWAVLRIEIAKGLSEPKDEVLQLANLAREKHPRYWPLYVTLAEYLLPRWHGQPGDAAKFANDMPEGSDAKLAMEVFGRMAVRVYMYEGLSQTLLQGFDLATLRVSMNHLAATYPESIDYNNLACYLAWITKDREHLQQFMPFVESHLQLRFWPSKKVFEEAKAWAEEVPEPDAK